MQVAHRDAASCRHLVGPQIRVADVASDEGLDPRQMRRADGGSTRGQHALVRLDGQRQKVDKLAANNGTGFLGHVVVTRGDQVDHVHEKAIRPVCRIELQRAEAVRRTDPTAKHVLAQLHDPKVGGFGVAELIRLMAAFDEEGTGVCTDLLAALGEADFGLGGQRHQKLFRPRSAEMLRQAAIQQRIGGQPRQRHTAKIPRGQLTIKGLGPRKCQVQREIGPRDRLVPVPTAARLIDPTRCNGAFHRVLPPFTHQATGARAGQAGISPPCTERQKPVHPVQRRGCDGTASLLRSKAQQTPRDRVGGCDKWAFCPAPTLLRGPYRRAS